MMLMMLMMMLVMMIQCDSGMCQDWTGPGSVLSWTNVLSTGAADSIFGRVSKVALGYPKASRPPPLKKSENS